MDPVVKLTPNDFDINLRLKKYKQFVLIKFFAPWCGHCKAMSEDYKNLAFRQQINNKKLIIAEFDCEKYKSFIDNIYNKFSNTYKIEGYPTILIYKNGLFLTEYNGNGRSAMDFEKFFKKYNII